MKEQEKREQQVDTDESIEPAGEQELEETTAEAVIDEEEGKLTIEDIMEHLQQMEEEEEEPVELTPAEQLVEFIKENSEQIRLTKLEDFYGEPLSFSEEEVAEYLEEIAADEQYADIKAIKGSKTRYFYWEKMITTNYANLMARVEDKDLVRMIGETVREETKRYRRATGIKLFSFPPFSLAEQQVLDLLPMLQEREDFADIEQIIASTGALYLYSNKHISKVLVKSLVEWEEVERFENP